ncbi:MAG: hypothetical protein R6V58_01790 [Planctomycetota bacterium]
MGARASVSFQNGKIWPPEKSIVIFSHWGGVEFHQEAKDYLKNLKQDIKDGKVSPIYPLGRLEPNTVAIDFIRHITKGLERVESDLYLGKDESDGDNSDYGHLSLELEDGEDQSKTEVNLNTNLIVSREDIKELKKRYNEAVKNGEEVFEFQRQQILTTYAKYLIEYLENLRII